jgi:hypothetical protein
VVDSNGDRRRGRDIFHLEQEQEALERQKQAAWDQYELGKEYSDSQYAINRGEAGTQAAIQQGRLDRNVGQSVDQFNLGLLSQAYGVQNAQIQTASNIGASLAAEGMGGTRGNEANGLMRAYEQKSLDRNVALQQRGSDLSLQGMLSQASDTAADIRRERESWDPGGYRYRQKEAQDAYNLGMANLGQENFDWQIAQAEPTALDYITGGIQGGSTGLDLWNSWNYASQFMGNGNGNAGGSLLGSGGVNGNAGPGAAVSGVPKTAAPAAAGYSPSPGFTFTPSWDTLFSPYNAMGRNLRDSYANSGWF